MEKVNQYKSEVDSLMDELDYLESQSSDGPYFNYCGEEITLKELKDRIVEIEIDLGW